MNTKIAIIGAGPAGLFAALKLKQTDPKLNVNIFEKAKKVGEHLVSGAIIENEIYKNYILPFEINESTIIKTDKLIYLTNKTHLKQILTPTIINNRNNYLISLTQLCKSLSKVLKANGIRIFTNAGITNIHCLKHGNIIETVKGIKIFAKYTIVAEGTHGIISNKIYNMLITQQHQPQKYAISTKEFWTNNDSHKSGTVYHTLGWPLSQSEWGGGFVYFYKNYISIGFIIYSKYKNTYLNPNNEFLKFKSHEFIKNLLRTAKVTSYSARSLTIGGIKSLQTLQFSNGIIIGCAAGLINNLKLKGIHNAILSGIQAATHYFLMFNNKNSILNKDYIHKNSITELNLVKNTSILIHKINIFIALLEHWIRNIIDINLFNKLKFKQPDWQTTKTCTTCKPKRDWKTKAVITKLLTLAEINYNKANHLKIKDSFCHKLLDLKIYGKLSNRFCPANVYVWIKTHKHYNIKINSENCLQCKLCCIKAPEQNILWTVPKGGPRYKI